MNKQHPGAGVSTYITKKRERALEVPEQGESRRDFKVSNKTKVRDSEQVNQ